MAAGAPRIPPRENGATRQSLRDLTGADEAAPSPRQSEPRGEPLTPPTGGPAATASPQSPAGRPPEGTARSMARMIAELKEPGATGRNASGAVLDRPQRQAGLPPDSPPGESSLRDGPDGNFADCVQCPIMSVITARDLITGRDYSGTSEGRRSRPPSTFAVSKYEVSVREWNACVEEGGCRQFRSYGAGGPHASVKGVTSAEAADYATWLSRKTGRIYRLLKPGGWTSREDLRSGDNAAPDEPWQSGRGNDRGSAASNAGFRVSRSLRQN
jgi:hypothetical protein